MEIITKSLIKYEVSISTKKFNIKPMWKKLYYVNKNRKLFSLEEGYTDVFYEHSYKGINIYTSSNTFSLSTIGCFGPSGWSNEVNVRVVTDENITEKELINLVGEVVNYNYNELKNEYERMERVQIFTETFVRENNSLEATKERVRDEK